LPQLVDGRLRYVHNRYGAARDVVDGDIAITPGRHELAFRFTKTAELRGRGEVVVDGTVAGTGEIPHFTPMTFSYTGGGLTCGYEVGPAIGAGYEAPFRANVVIDRVVIDVGGDALLDAQARYDAIMAQQ